MAPTMVFGVKKFHLYIYADIFIVTHHKPLESLFNEKKVIPTTTSFVLFCPIGEQQLLRSAVVYSFTRAIAQPYLLSSFINVQRARETFFLISLDGGEISK